MKRYNTIEEIPEWAKEAITDLCAKGVLQGRNGEFDADGYPMALDLSDDMLRMFVINYRAGVYDVGNLSDIVDADDETVSLFGTEYT